MSILDGMMENEKDLVQAFKIAAPAIEQMLEAMQFDERQTSVIELMKKGLSLADILDISREQRDALLTHGLRLLQSGEIQKSRDALVTLYQLEPLDERVIYGLAAGFQMEGDYATAGKLYVQFLALDATNAEGHLRLGECFLAAREYENARAFFESALVEAERGHGAPHSLEHAKRMLDVVNAAMN